jgi:hypothetical protein
MYYFFCRYPRITSHLSVYINLPDPRSNASAVSSSLLSSWESLTETWWASMLRTCCTRLQSGGCPSTSWHKTMQIPSINYEQISPSSTATDPIIAVSIANLEHSRWLIHWHSQAVVHMCPHCLCSGCPAGVDGALLLPLLLIPSSTQSIAGGWYTGISRLWYVPKPQLLCPRCLAGVKYSR